MTQARHLILIDDDPAIHRLVELALAARPTWQLHCTDDPLSAIERAQREAPDAILLDANMPATSGPTAIRLLKAMPATAPIPVLFLTSRSRPEDVAHFEALGARSVFAKPIDVTRFAGQVADALGWG